MFTTLSRRLLRVPSVHFSSKRTMASVVLGEVNGSSLSPATLATVSAANSLGQEITVLVTGKEIANACSEASKLSNVAKVVSMDDEKLDKQMAETTSKVIFSYLEKNKDSFTHVLAPASPKFKGILPRVAALLDVQMLTDVIKIDDKDTFTRPMYAGNALATMTNGEKMKVISVRGTAFEAASSGDNEAPIESVNVDGSTVSQTSKFISEQVSKSDRPDLTAAKIVVSGGRGLKNKENFEIIDKLADKLGAAVGASRAAVDEFHMPNELQVGQTGKVVAPDLYIAVGISGAIQHLSGMKDSKTVVCINKDKEAPIFQVSDYGLAADLFDAVPELTEKV